ncbi:MAG: L-seryl-tRNA(Sec) selenium transferase [Candidatus Cloacimonadota bacterium]|nr:MAG: L-seryl-tRNA(Sec) selenium transferase [Candidatus Cloacimonadota bacterium]PIE77427.1 MAG: L-seryl-tRNA(Sec) selenium transferase [Candidatus Delongbacteria bacterium]
MKKELFKMIPKVDLVIEDERLIPIFENYDRKLIVKIIGDELNLLRKDIASGKVKSLDYDFVIKRVLKRINIILSDFTTAMVNGTGIVLNTGLGRAPLSKSAVEKALSVMEGYSTLEVDVKSGKRGRREDKIDSLVSLLTGVEAATVVNNNAAAVMICLNALAEDKEVIISRGEQVEIGGSFRMPDIIEKSGCIMKEVGATNKTHPFDYENNITENTGALVKVHTSNYKVKGFVEETSLEEISDIAKRYKIYSYYDLGGGIIEDLGKYGLPHEPLVQESIRAGIDLVSFSGDKVLGGPQCGIIAGKRELVEKVKKNPYMRAFRLDKIRLALLEETLKGYLKNSIREVNTTFNLLTMGVDELENRAKRLKEFLVDFLPDDWKVETEAIEDQAGSGTMPTQLLNGWAISIDQKKVSPNKLSEQMRVKSSTPVFGFVRNEKYYLSVRTIFDKDYQIIEENLKAIIDDL